MKDFAWIHLSNPCCKPLKANLKSKLDWTSLPGPEQFLNRVEESIRRTRSVIAFVPACSNEAWIVSIRERLGNDFAWKEIKGGPAEFLQEVSNRADGRAFVHCSEIIQEGVVQNLFCIREAKAMDLPAWQELLIRFSESQRSEIEFKRNVILLPVQHTDFSEITGEQLDLCSLHDHLRAEDAYFMASRFVAGSRDKFVEDEIRLHVAAELALWDFELCNFLCESKLEDILNPLNLLLRYAETKKNDSVNWAAVFEPAWSPNNRSRKLPLHSVLVALSNDVVELTRRIWRGQVQALFPLIEEQRCLLIEQLRTRAPMILRNFKDSDGPIEIGPLHAAICRFQSKCPKELRSLSWHLKEMRNELAHLRVCQLNILPRSKDLLK
jgi:hypothetical protein